MDVQINNLTSNVHVADARALLAPDLLRQIAEAVAAYMREQDRQRQERERDTRIDRRASELD